MKSARIATATVATFTALALSGCGDAPSVVDGAEQAGTEDETDGVVGLPGDAQPGEDSPDALTHGVLAADSDDGCVWLVEGIEEGEPIEPEMSLLWPAGYSFDTSTQEILGRDGNVVAVIGERVALGGGETPHRTPERCAVADRVWSVSTVESRG